MQTIVELPEHTKRADKLINEPKANSIINYLAAHPAAGNLMKGTGGIRKLRWSSQGRGKSGGVRIIYHNQSMPLLLLTLFGKGEKDNLTKGERNDLAKFTSQLISNYGGKK